MSESQPQHFDNYDQFFAYYMRQHSQRSNRILHACGTSLALLSIVVAFALGLLRGLGEELDQVALPILIPREWGREMQLSLHRSSKRRDLQNRT